MTFAHESGASWDEWLFVFVPLALFAVVIWRAKLRAEREHDREHEPSE